MRHQSSLIDTCLNLIAGLALVLTICGCSKESVVSGIDQRQAREVVSALATQGIIATAATERGARRAFSIEVSKGDYPIAINILNALGLPRDQPPSFLELTEQKGFLPNTREVEAARLDYALGSEVEEKLRAIDGVRTVRVLIRSNILKQGQEPSASVFITTQNTSAFDPKEIVSLMSLVVPGLTPQRTVVMVKQAKDEVVSISNEGVENISGKVVHRPLVKFLGFFSIPEEDVQKLAGAILGLLALAAGVAFASGYFYGGRSNVRSSPLTGAGVMVAKLSADRPASRIRIDSSSVQGDDFTE